MGEFKFDVFLSHNSKDKPAVEQLAERLEDEAGLTVFLDTWNLIPGDPWQEDLEQALDDSRTMAVFLGPSGIGSWHNQEMRNAINTRIYDKNRRVIPVLLPKTTMPEEGTLPKFLTHLTWVDFRKGLNDVEAFNRLVSGIKGIAPGRRNRTVTNDAALISSTSVAEPPPALTSITWTLDQKGAVVNALLICPCISNRQMRDNIVNELPLNIRNAISRSEANRPDVTNILTTCLNYAGGLQKLVGVIEFYDNEAIPVQQLKLTLSGMGAL